MRLLIAFFIRNYVFFLFLLLEVVSITLLINHNKYHSSVFINATADYTGELHEAFTNINEYFSLREENAKLAGENAKLRNKLSNSASVTDSLFHFKDSVYRYTEAEVISKSTRRKNNFFLLNKGEKHGVTTDMGVIADKGVVGIITGVSDNYAVVMPLIHKHSRLSALIGKNNQLVNVVWEETDYKKGNVKDIPIHIELHEGDSIFTSGYSFYFPRGILIGKISETSQKISGRSLNMATIDYAVDFNKLTHVYIVENLNRKELKELLDKSIIDE